MKDETLYKMIFFFFVIVLCSIVNFSKLPNMNIIIWKLTIQQISTPKEYIHILCVHISITVKKYIGPIYTTKFLVLTFKLSQSTILK